VSEQAGPGDRVSDFGSPAQRELGLQAKAAALDLQSALAAVASAEARLADIVASLARDEARLSTADIAILAGLQSSYVDALLSGGGYTSQMRQLSG